MNFFCRISWQIQLFLLLLGFLLSFFLSPSPSPYCEHVRALAKSPVSILLLLLLLRRKWTYSKAKVGKKCSSSSGKLGLGGGRYLKRRRRGGGEGDLGMFVSMQKREGRRASKVAKCWHIFSHDSWGWKWKHHIRKQGAVFGQKKTWKCCHKFAGASPARKHCTQGVFS